MVVLVDENIPYGREAFGCLGEVRIAHGRSINNDMLRDVDALIVRSITRVNHDLLHNTPVRFVGTCTIGEDHIDREYLAKAGIAFSSAPGCNANSVAEYIVTSLILLAEHLSLDLADMKLGIVGVGNVGSKVFRKASALGMTCVLNDPPLAQRTEDMPLRPLDEIMTCDIITFHTPMERKGQWPTWHLADEAFLAKLKPNTILFNTSRGAVVDNAALVAALRSGSLRTAVLDVWENEPTPIVELIRRAVISTPHIAGYSFDGKVNGTNQVYRALCDFLGVTATWDPRRFLPPPPCPELFLDPAQPGALLRAVTQVYDLSGDDAGMRKIPFLPPQEHGSHFDRLRKEYPVRREFFNTTIHLTRPDPLFSKCLSGIGFVVNE